MIIRKHDLSKCKSQLERDAVTALLEIEVYSSVIPKGTQEAIWRVLIKPFDEMEKLKIIPKREQKLESIKRELI